MHSRLLPYWLQIFKFKIITPTFTFFLYLPILTLVHNCYRVPLRTLITLKIQLVSIKFSKFPNPSSSPIQIAPLRYSTNQRSSLSNKLSQNYQAQHLPTQTHTNTYTCSLHFASRLIAQR